MTQRAGRRVHRRLAIAGLLAGLWFGLNAEPHRTGIAADSAAIYALLLDDLPHAAPTGQPIRRDVRRRALRAAGAHGPALAHLPALQGLDLVIRREMLDRGSWPGALHRK